jgi:hypothetical protein
LVLAASVTGMPFDIQVLIAASVGQPGGSWETIRKHRGAEPYRFSNRDIAERVMHSMFDGIVDAGCVRVKEVKTWDI